MEELIIDWGATEQFHKLIDEITESILNELELEENLR